VIIEGDIAGIFARGLCEQAPRGVGKVRVIRGFDFKEDDHGAQGHA
jgi:hypothetical protein